MAQLTGWTPDQLQALRPGEFNAYLELALRLRGVKPDDIHTGAPPPDDDDDPGIDPQTLLHLPESVLLMYPVDLFRRLSPAEQQRLPSSVRAKLAAGD